MKKMLFYAVTIILIVFYAFLLSGLMGLVGDHGVGKDGDLHILHHIGAGVVIAFMITGLASQLLNMEL